MNRGRRRAHGVIWLLLAIALPLLVVLAIGARHERPAQAPSASEAR